MKVRILEDKRSLMGEFSTKDLLEGKVYDATIDNGKHKWYRIVDESGEDYIYPPDIFEIVEE